MGLSSEDISLLMKYGGYSFDDVKRLSEQEQCRALDAIKAWKDIEMDGPQGTIGIWGTDETTAENT